MVYLLPFFCHTPAKQIQFETPHRFRWNNGTTGSLKIEGSARALNNTGTTLHAAVSPRYMGYASLLLQLNTPLGVDMAHKPIVNVLQTPRCQETDATLIALRSGLQQAHQYIQAHALNLYHVIERNSLDLFQA